jgi:hypothetical protein
MQKNLTTKRSWVLIPLLISTCAFSRQEPTLQFLNFWPSARATGIAGSFTGIADDAYTAYYNPAALPFLKEKHIALTHSNVLPGLYAGMHYLCLGYSSPLKNKHGWGIFIPYFANGTGQATFPDGTVYGEYSSHCFAVAGAYGYQIKKNLGLGAAIKFIYFNGYDPDLWWGWLRLYGIGIPPGPGASWGLDFGLFYKPSSRLSLGLTIQNFGPKVSPPNTHVSDPLPFTSRLGIKYEPVKTKTFSLIIAPELTKNLIGMFYDPDDTLSFFQELDNEFKDLYKSFGVELTILKLLSVRVGYYADVTHAKGGLVINEGWGSAVGHAGILDYLFNKSKYPGYISGIGLTFGFGLSFKGFSLDIGSDQLIYDFPTTDTKISLSYRF